MSKPLSLDQARSTLRTVLASQRQAQERITAATPIADKTAPSVSHAEASVEEPAASTAFRSIHAVPSLPASLPVPSTQPLQNIAVAASADTTAETHAGAAAAPARAKIPVAEPTPVATPAVERKVAVEEPKPAPVLKKSESAETAPEQPAAAHDAAPSFAILEAHQRRTNPVMVAGIAIVLVIAAGATAWTVLPNFRSKVLWQYGQLTHHAKPVVSQPAPAPQPAAPVVQTDATAPQPTTNAATADVAPAVPLAQGFQDADAAAPATATPAATTSSTTPATSDASAATILVPAELADAHLTHRVSPWYPTKARQAHIKGSVVVMANVATDGTVQSVDVVKGNPMLTLAAQEAVKQWQYQPYFKDGQAVAFQTQVTVSFPAARAAASQN
jgi:TonB family protein